MRTRMSKKHFFGLVALVMVSVLAGTALGFTGTHNAAALENATKLEGVVTSPFTEAVDLVHSSVVGVSNYKTYQSSGYGYGFDFGYGGRGNRDDSSGQTREVLAATGSGTVISAEGHVLTNYHVIDSAAKVTVTAGDKEYDAQVIAYDADLDLAILQAKDLNLKPVALGDSDSLKLGEWAIVIGNPLSDTFVGTTTVGIISGLNRTISTGTSTDRYGRMTSTDNVMIQVDASINSGNSGGGMFNVLGELMGIPTIKYSSSGYFGGASIEGIGMCIPINTAKPLIDKVLSGEIRAADQTGESGGNAPAEANDTAAPRPRMGISFNSINGATFNQILPSGAYVAEVEKGSPAEQGGILPGDIIVEVDGQIVGSSSKDMQDLIAAHQAGDIVKVTVYRAQGLQDVMTRYFDRQNIPYSDIPSDGEYVELDVTLQILDAVTQQQ